MAARLSWRLNCRLRAAYGKAALFGAAYGWLLQSQTATQTAK